MSDNDFLQSLVKGRKNYDYTIESTIKLAQAQALQNIANAIELLAEDDDNGEEEFGYGISLFD